MDRTSTEGSSSPTAQGSARLTLATLLRQLAVIVVVLVVWSGILIGYLALTNPSKDTPAATPTPSDPAQVSFAADVLPIFESRCQRCHGAGLAQVGLRLTSYADVLAGSSNGPVVVPSSAKDSYLVDQIESGRMPLGGAKLPESEIQTIVDWINAGAPDN
jgi:mono/diheme cytochrome c family protein